MLLTLTVSSFSTCQESTNRCQTTLFKVACPSNIGDMCIHSKMTYFVLMSFFTSMKSIKVKNIGQAMGKNMLFSKVKMIRDFMYPSYKVSSCDECESAVTARTRFVLAKFGICC